MSRPVRYKSGDPLSCLVLPRLCYNIHFTRHASNFYTSPCPISLSYLSPPSHTALSPHPSQPPFSTLLPHSITLPHSTPSKPYPLPHSISPPYCTCNLHPTVTSQHTHTSYPIPPPHTNQPLQPTPPAYSTPPLHPTPSSFLILLPNLILTRSIMTVTIATTIQVRARRELAKSQCSHLTLV